MERNEIQTAMAAAVEEVLETMCFAAVLASGECALPPGAPPGGQGDANSITAALRFQGAACGRFRVSVSMKLARVMGAGFLGREEQEVSDAQAGEVICELANMICGSVLSRLESDAAFQMTHPELVAGMAATGSGGCGSCRWYDLGDGILTTSLELQQAI